MTPGRTFHHRDDDDDDVLSPAEQREAMRVQRELLAVVHADGEARTRASDKAPRSLLDSATTFLLGVLIGALATFAGLNGRLTATETTLANHSTSILELKTAVEEARASNREILGILRAEKNNRDK